MSARHALSVIVAAGCMSASASVSADTLTETFDEPFADWTGRWLYENSNIGSFYVASPHFDCDQSDRGNNPCGLWFADTKTCNEGVTGIVSEIVFDPAFAQTIRSVGFDITSFNDLRIIVKDTQGLMVLDVPSVVQTRDHCRGFRYEATSDFGIGSIRFESTNGAQVEGNHGLDNFTVETADVVLTKTSCPDPLTLSVTGATPNGQIALVYGTGTGFSVVPDGYTCAGTSLDLAGPVRVAGIANADASGNLVVSSEVHPGACGVLFQAIDASTCVTSNVVN